MNITPTELYVGTWMHSITKASSILTQIYPEAILCEEPITKLKSRPTEKARFDVNMIVSFHVKGGDLGVILANVLMCERNWKPTEDQYFI